MADIQEITIEPIAGKTFGAVVRNISLVELTDEQFTIIHQAFLDYGFLVFPAQFLSEADNVRFGERFRRR